MSDETIPMIDLTAAELRTLSALVDTMFPATDDGPGATTIGVVEYIAAQVAAPWGLGARMYRHGPFQVPPHGGHGWQSSLTPAAAYRHGLGAIDRWVRTRHAVAGLGDLSAGERERVVAALEAGEIDTFTEFSANAFFALVRRTLLEGLFSDPVHGGNRSAAGWRWIGHAPDPS